MGFYVRQRVAEIKADPALRRQPLRPLNFRDQVSDVARWLAMLANANRLLAVVHLIDGEKTVGELAGMVGLSPSALSQHLALLTKEGIVESRADGARRYYSCKSEAAKAVLIFFNGLAIDEKIPAAFRARRL